MAKVDKPKREDPKTVVHTQSQDEALWFEPLTAPEAYLQSALRRLHCAVLQLPPPEETEEGSN